MQTHHYMQKKNGPIKKVELNEWARHRRSGYEFRTELEYQNQQAERTDEEREKEKLEEKEKNRPRKKRTMRRTG